MSKAVQRIIVLGLLGGIPLVLLDGRLHFPHWIAIAYVVGVSLLAILMSFRSDTKNKVG